MHVAILSHSPNAKFLLRAYLSAQNISFEFIEDPSIYDYTECTYVIVTEPTYIENEPLQCGSVMRNYLKTHFSHLNLILAGILPSTQSNYLDLFQLPQNFSDFTAKLIPLSEHWTIHHLEPNCLQKQLLYFFHDHGKRSFFDSYPNFQTTLEITHKNYINGVTSYVELCKEAIPLAQDQWPELRRRWELYLPLFRQTPFFPEVKKIDRELGDFTEFFQYGDVLQKEELFKSGDFLNRFKNIITDLDKLKGSYLT